MERQRDHAHDVAVASQAAIDTLRAVLSRLDLPEPELESTNADNAI